ncbi:MAG TPA: YcnI family protein [Hyphomicrobiales bacterium]|nr:YcnI family protein [Hyphomicrobiales bacterium]
MSHSRLLGAAVGGAFMLAASAASAHITLAVPEATVGTFYKAVFRVPHGCDGEPTLKVRVRIPDGVIGVKPQPKPGWTLSTVIGKYPAPVAFMHGQTLAEGVKEVDWSGRLPDDDYDEFAVFAYLGDALKPGTRLYWPAVQECAKGANRWIEIPAAGQDAEKLEHPAPSLELLPPKR